MPSRRAFFTGTALFGTLATSGCLDRLPLGDPPVEDVEIQITDARSLDFGLSSITIPVMLRVRNTNDSTEVPSPTLDYTVEVNGEEVASSRTELPTLDPRGQLTEEIELIAEYSDLGTGIVNTIREGNLLISFTGIIESEGATAEISDTYEF